MSQGHKVVLAGCFGGEASNTAWLVQNNAIPQPLPEYSTNAEETDLRIWRHVFKTGATRILLYSPDTDVYNIGLGLLGDINKDIVIQINLPHLDNQFLNLNGLSESLTNDPDLATIPTESCQDILQVLFISTGCDYISYFSGFGKASFLNIFFQHAEFITSGSLVQGTLADSNIATGFLAFVRLIGTAYFKKHLSAFVSRFGLKTPGQLYNSLDNAVSLEDHHKQWLETIRAAIVERITNEEERVPSYTALWRHWLRSCWVHKVWKQAANHNIVFPQPQQYGWKVNEDASYSIEWEADEVVKHIEDTVSFLCKGCHCSKGCGSRCGCRRKAKHCGPGCDCQGCTNLDVVISDESTDEAHQQEQKEQRRRKEMTDNLMVDDDTDDDTEDECFDSENVGIHDVEIITGTFTMGDDLLSEPL